MKIKFAMGGRVALLVALVTAMTALLTATALTAGAQEPTRSATTETTTSLRVTKAKRHVLAGTPARVKGRIASGQSARTVLLQVRGRRGGYRTVDRARTTRGGRFTASWRAKAPGIYKARVRLGGAAAATAKGDYTRVRVYRSGHASWYGPGFYGRRTACGGTLGTGTKGVAHKSLPCGTRVTFRYRGRSVTVPVIDRGPYAAGRTWDLTGATKRALGFPSTGTVWSTR